MTQTNYDQFTEEILAVLAPEQRAEVEKEHGDGSCAATAMRLIQVREVERSEDIAEGAEGVWALFRCSLCLHRRWVQISPGRERAA